MTIEDFLLARIAEDEAVAANGPIAHTNDLVVFEADESFCIEIPTARLLAECAAKRRIVNDAGFAAHLSDINDKITAAAIHAPALLARHILSHMAWVYHDHPDYQQNWKA